MKRLIMLCLIVLLWACTGDAQTRTKIADARLIHRVGDICVAVFRATEDGSLGFVRISTFEYVLLALAGAVAPPPNGLDTTKTWVFAWAVRHEAFDTASAMAEIGNLYTTDDPPTNALLILPNREPLGFLLSQFHIINDPVLGVTVEPDPPGFAIRNGELFEVTP